MDVDAILFVSVTGFGFGFGLSALVYMVGNAVGFLKIFLKGGE